MIKTEEMVAARDTTLRGIRGRRRVIRIRAVPVQIEPKRRWISNSNMVLSIVGCYSSESVWVWSCQVVVEGSRSRDRGLLCGWCVILDTLNRDREMLEATRTSFRIRMEITISKQCGKSKLCWCEDLHHSQFDRNLLNWIKTSATTAFRLPRHSPEW